jgi:hypothetical protein
MKLSKIVTLATAGTAAASISLFGLGVTAAQAVNGVEPITFEVGAGGFLTLDQVPTLGTPLVEATPVDLPDTTITDTRNGTTRNWTVTATASDLVSGANTILAEEVVLGQSGGWLFGGGTVGSLGLVSASADTIDSVYGYTPTAEIADQSNLAAGSYAGTVTQTVL